MMHPLNPKLLTRIQICLLALYFLVIGRRVPQPSSTVLQSVDYGRESDCENSLGRASLVVDKKRCLVRLPPVSSSLQQFNSKIS